MIPSWTVTPIPSPTMSLTLRSANLNDGPRSPRRRLNAQLTYWTGSRASRPYLMLRRRTVGAGSAFSRAQGTPGTECMSRKVSNETTKSTGMIQRTRPAIYLVIADPSRHCCERAEYTAGVARRTDHPGRTYEVYRLVLEDLDVLEEEVAVVLGVLRRRISAGHPRTDLVVADAPACEYGGSVLDKHLLRLVVQRQRLLERHRSGLLDELVVLGVVVPLVIVAALAVEQHPEDVVRMRIIQAPCVPGDARAEQWPLGRELLERHALEL